METLNRKQKWSLNEKLNGKLNETLNGNLTGNLNGNWGKPDGNLNEPNLGPNWDQQASWCLGIPGWSLGAPWRVLGGSLEGGSLEGSLGDQTGTQGWSGTGDPKSAQSV